MPLVSISLLKGKSLDHIRALSDGVHRTDDVVFIHIAARNWRDTATKKTLYKRIAKDL